jgi:hypothetical protein
VGRTEWTDDHHVDRARRRSRPTHA